jgi:hypothetical protein
MKRTSTGVVFSAYPSEMGAGKGLGGSRPSMWVAFVCVFVLACTSGEKSNERRPPASVPRVEAARSLDLGAVVERARLSFRSRGGGFEAHASTFVAHIEGAKTSVGAMARDAASPSGELTLEVTRIGRHAGLRSRASGATSRRSDGSVVTDLGEAVEVRRNTPDGLEQQWEFSRPPAGSGDLVIRVKATGLEFRNGNASGLHFADPRSGSGVRYGIATWVDAHRTRTTVVPVFDRGEIVLVVPESVVARTIFPAVLDPIISPEIGIDRPVPTRNVGSRVMRLARAGGTYLVVWTEYAGYSGTFLLGARIDAVTGALLDPLGFTVAEPVELQRSGGPSIQALTPFAVGSNGTDFAVVWGEARDPSSSNVMDVYARRVRADGTVLDGEIYGAGARIGTGGDQPAPEIVYGGANYYVAWRAGTSAGGYEVVGTRLGGTTLAKLDSQPAATGLEGLGAIGLSTDGTTALLSANNQFSRVGLSDGIPIGTPQQFAVNSKTNPLQASAAFDGKNYLILWTDGLDVFLSHVTPAGTVLEPPSNPDPGGIRLCGYWGPSGTPVIVSDGNDTIVLTSQYNFGIIGARIDSDTGQRLDGGLGYCAEDLGLHSGWGDPFSMGAVVSNGELFVVGGGEGRRFDTAALAPKGPAQIVQAMANSAYDAVVASNTKDFLVVWSEGRRPLSDVTLFAARVAADGTVLDPDGIPLFTGAPVLSPAVASAGDDYLVSWVDWSAYEPVVGHNRVCATRVRGSDGAMLDGSPQSCGVVLYDELVTNALSHVRVASDGKQYLIAWSAYYPGIGVQAALIDASTSSLAVDGGVRSLSLSAPPATFQPVALAAIPATPSTPSRFLVASNGFADVQAALLDTATGALGTPVIFTGSKQEVVHLRAVTDGNDFLLLYGQATDPWTNDQYGNIAHPPIVARIRGSDFSVLPPGSFGLRTTHPLENSVLAYDGQHYWAAWIQSGYPFESSIMSTRLGTTGAFLDGPGATGAFKVGDHEFGRGLDIAANRAGRVLVVYTAVAHAPFSMRLYGRFLEDTPSERDGGIVFHDASIPDALPPATGGAPADAGRMDAAPGSGGGTSTDAATGTGGAGGSETGGGPSSGGAGGAPPAPDGSADSGTGGASPSGGTGGVGPADARTSHDSAPPHDARSPNETGAPTDAPADRAVPVGTGGASGSGAAAGAGGGDARSSGGSGGTRASGGRTNAGGDGEQLRDASAGGSTMRDQAAAEVEGSGCDCRTARSRNTAPAPFWLALSILALRRRDRRR